MQRLRDNDQIRRSRTQSALLGRRHSILDVRMPRRLIQHGGAGIGRENPLKPTGQGKRCLAAAGSTVPGKLVPVDEAREIAEHLVGISRPAAGVSGGQPGEVIGERSQLRRRFRGIQRRRQAINEFRLGGIDFPLGHLRIEPRASVYLRKADPPSRAPGPLGLHAVADDLGSICVTFPRPAVDHLAGLLSNGTQREERALGTHAGFFLELTARGSKGVLTRLIEGNIAQEIVKGARVPVLLLPPDWKSPI